MDLLIRRLNPSSSVPQPLRRVCDMLASYLTSHKCRGIMGYVSHLLSPGYVRAGYTRPHPTHIRDTQRTFWGRINRNMSLHFLKGRGGVLEFETAVSPLSAAALTNLHSLFYSGREPAGAREQPVRKENPAHIVPCIVISRRQMGGFRNGLRASVPGPSPQHKAQECAVCARG